MSWELIDAFLLSLCSVLRHVPGITLGVRLSRLGSDFMGLIHLTIWLKFLSELGIQVDNIEPNGPGSKPVSSNEKDLKAFVIYFCTFPVFRQPVI